MASRYRHGPRGRGHGHQTLEGIWHQVERTTAMSDRSSDRRPQGPHPPVHILPCPYYTQTGRADSLYSRGERGEDARGGPLWSPVRYLLSCACCLCLLLLLALFLAACGGTNSLPTATGPGGTPAV